MRHRCLSSRFITNPESMGYRWLINVHLWNYRSLFGSPFVFTTQSVSVSYALEVESTDRVRDFPVTSGVNYFSEDLWYPVPVHSFDKRCVLWSSTKRDTFNPYFRGWVCLLYVRKDHMRPSGPNGDRLEKTLLKNWSYPVPPKTPPLIPGRYLWSGE